jgi:hypothetical protein
MHTEKTPPKAGRGEAGSAYIITLMALVVLTVLALSLAFITQTEVQVGANERTISRTFYSADSGIGIAVARALAGGQYGGTTVLLNETEVGYGGGAGHAAERVTITPLVPVQVTRCDWCPANDDGVPKFFKVNHVVTATSQRISWTGSDDPPADATLLGQKTISAMVEFQPVPAPSVESLRNSDDALTDIRF